MEGTTMGKGNFWLSEDMRYLELGVFIDWLKLEQSVNRGITIGGAPAWNYITNTAVSRFDYVTSTDSG